LENDSTNNETRLDAGDARDAEKPNQEKKTQAMRLIELAEGVKLFKDEDKNAWASFPVEDHWETYRLDPRDQSSLLGSWLSRRFYEETKRPPHREALRGALSVLESRAKFERELRQVNLRTAEYEERIYIDLGDSRWRAVEIDQRGWRLIERPPVKFYRPTGTQPLPEPVSGCSLKSLHPFLNLASDEDWALVVAWILAALLPKGPYPILLIQGYGTGKSSLSRILKELVDPRTGGLRGETNDPRDLIAAAKNARLLAFDNLSRLSAQMADCACRLATGGGFGGRQLYTNTEQALFEAKRPLLFNGIPDLGATRGDFPDRAIIVRLPQIVHRLPEEEFWQHFERVKAAIFGAFLDVIARWLRVRNEPCEIVFPRMADFVKLCVQCEPALGLKPGTFLRAYESNRTEAREVVLESSPVAEALIDFCRERETDQCPEVLWEGTATHLLDELSRRRDGYGIMHDRGLPRTPSGLSAELRRLNPDLRKIGIEIEFDRKNIARRIIIQKVSAEIGEAPSPASPSSDLQIEDFETEHEQGILLVNDGDPFSVTGIDVPKTVNLSLSSRLCKSQKDGD
jgi:hypothetical protein